MKNNDKKYFLKNSNLLAEIHNSKLTYCCYEDDKYSNYDIICKNYKLITPNVILSFFEKNKNRDYIIIRVMTDEHVLEYCKNGKVNLQELKMSPFKHYLLTRSDYFNVYSESLYNIKEISELDQKINDLKEEKKEVNRNIRLYKLDKNKQLPYKEQLKHINEEIINSTETIKSLASDFTVDIMKYMKEVLRSHWSGKTIESGHFDVSQGHLTEGLAYMIMMLVEQYAKSGNWSGYTYIDDMKGSALVHLCDVVLKYEESESPNAFSYLTQVASNKFTATLNSEKLQGKIKSRKMQEAGYNPTFSEQVNKEFKNIYYNEDEDGTENISLDLEDNSESNIDSDEN